MCPSSVNNSHDELLQLGCNSQNPWLSTPVGLEIPEMDDASWRAEKCFGNLQV